jgi:hypothetical protein
MCFTRQTAQLANKLLPEVPQGLVPLFSRAEARWGEVFVQLQEMGHDPHEVGQLLLTDNGNREMRFKWHVHLWFHAYLQYGFPCEIATATIADVHFNWRSAEEAQQENAGRDVAVSLLGYEMLPYEVGWPHRCGVSAEHVEALNAYLEKLNKDGRRHYSIRCSIL